VMFSVKVNNKYLATRGMVDEVGGIILETNKRNTTIDNKT